MKPVNEASNSGPKHSNKTNKLLSRTASMAFLQRTNVNQDATRKLPSLIPKFIEKGMMPLNTVNKAGFKAVCKQAV